MRLWRELMCSNAPKRHTDRTHAQAPSYGHCPHTRRAPEHALGHPTKGASPTWFTTPQSASHGIPQRAIRPQRRRRSTFPPLFNRAGQFTLTRSHTPKCSPTDASAAIDTGGRPSTRTPHRTQHAPTPRNLNERRAVTVSNRFPFNNFKYF